MIEIHIAESEAGFLIPEYKNVDRFFSGGEIYNSCFTVRGSQDGSD